MTQPFEVMAVSHFHADITTLTHLKNMSYFTAYLQPGHASDSASYYGIYSMQYVAVEPFEVFLHVTA